MVLEITDLQKQVVIGTRVRELIESLYTTILTSELDDGSESPLVSLVFVERETIVDLNSRFLGREGATDVLSFPLDEGQGFLGEVVIAPEVARDQAREYGHDLQRELAYLVVHGLLHLLGYDHSDSGQKEEMREKEERFLAAHGLNR